MVLLNKTFGANKALQTNIGALRQEILFAEDDKIRLRTQIKELAAKATEANKDSVVQARQASETHN